jgi:DHA1 family tetracycline resistance protein-like MFS transporter
MLGLLAFVHAPLCLPVGIVLFGIGSGLVESAQNSLVSQAVGPEKQGVVQGSSQSIQSLARILGPLAGGVLYAQFGHATPSWPGALVADLAIIFTFLALPGLRASKQRNQQASHLG